MSSTYGWTPGARSARGDVVVVRYADDNVLGFQYRPTPDRNRKTTWKEFLRHHWELMVAADFFTTEVWTSKGLTRYLVLFFIDLSTRKDRNCGNCLAREWSMDESSRPQRDRCGGWHSKWQALPDPRSRSALHRGISKHSEKCRRRLREVAAAITQSKGLRFTLHLFRTY